MPLLRDRRGRTLPVRVDVAAALRLRDLAGLDLMGAAVDGGAAVEACAADPARCVDCLYAILLPRLSAEGVTERAFGRRLAPRLAFRRPRVSPFRDVLRFSCAAFFDRPGPPPDVRSPGAPPTAAELWREVWRLAGLAGVDPRPLAFGELCALAEGRRRHDWPRTARVESAGWAAAGVVADAAELDPTGVLAEAGAARSAGAEVGPDDLSLLAAVFCSGR